MGEEWGASTPWQYFTDHVDRELAAAVSKGRAEEFSAHGWGGVVPDPQSPQTWHDSTLRWAELADPGHARMLDWYRQLIRLRREVPDLSDPTLRPGAATREGDVVTVVRGDHRVVVNLGETSLRQAADGSTLVAAWDASLEDGTLEVAPDGCAILRG